MQFVMTGHKGLIGSSVLKRLIERGDKAIGLIDLRDGSQDVNNICDIGNLKLKQTVDLMIHFAAFCKINKSIEKPELPYEHNVLGTHRVLEFCRKNDIPKIIFTSSSRVLSPEKNSYTASKIYGEELVKGYRDSYGIDYVILRPSTVYGPFNDFTKRLMDIFMLNVLQGKELEIYGDKDKTLDFTYVDDFVEGTLIAMNQKNQEYDISSGKQTKVSYVAEKLIEINNGGTYKFLPPEIAQPQSVAIDISKIKEFGFERRVGIETGLNMCYDWYKSNFKEILASRGLGNSPFADVLSSVGI